MDWIDIDDDKLPENIGKKILIYIQFGYQCIRIATLSKDESGTHYYKLDGKLFDGVENISASKVKYWMPLPNIPYCCSCRRKPVFCEGLCKECFRNDCRMEVMGYN